LITVTWSSVADLLVFVQQLRSPLALETSTHMAILTRLRSLSGDSLKSKLQRAMRNMSEPPLEIPFEAMVNQTGKEIVAAEKYAALDAKRDLAKGPQDRRAVQDRHRKEGRIPT
jgi:hypothetical protein